MSHSEQTHELAAALSKAQGSMKTAYFNKVNPHFKSKYADLAAVWEAIREPLSKNGLAVTQTMESDGNGSFMLHTILHHASGQWLSSDYPLPAGAKPQELGSALTYARRYSLSAIVGIAADEDDDANEAQKAPVRLAIGKQVTIAERVKSGDLEVIEAGGEAPPILATPIREPHEITLGDGSVDWPWFGSEMIKYFKTEKWAEWREANMLNMERMKNEAPKTYAIMLANFKKVGPG